MHLQRCVGPGRVEGGVTRPTLQLAGQEGDQAANDQGDGEVAGDVVD